MRVSESKHVTEFVKLWMCEGFREDVCYHIVHRAISEGHNLGIDSLTDEMKMSANVLQVSMESGIFWKRDGSLIVAEDSGGWKEWLYDFDYEFTEPDHFLRSVSECDVLRLSAG